VDILHFSEQLPFQLSGETTGPEVNSRLVNVNHVLSNEGVYPFLEHLIEYSVFQQVLELSSPPRASGVLRECATACVKSTYQYLFENCQHLYRVTNLCNMLEQKQVKYMN